MGDLRDLSKACSLGDDNPDDLRGGGGDFRSIRPCARALKRKAAARVSMRPGHESRTSSRHVRPRGPRSHNRSNPVMKLKLACADFTFPLLSHDHALDLIAILNFQGVDIGLF